MQAPRLSPQVMLIGNVGASDLRRLRSAVEAMWQSGAPVVDVDLTHTSTLDDDALSLLVTLYGEGHRRHLTLRLAGARGAVLSILRDTCLDRIFELVPSAAPLAPLSERAA